MLQYGSLFHVSVSLSLTHSLTPTSIHFSAGDRIIAAGEYASFAGIILQGTFYAHVTPTLQVPLTAGETLGSEKHRVVSGHRGEERMEKRDS